MKRLLTEFGPSLLLLAFAVVLLRFPQEFTRRNLKEAANTRLAIRLKRIGWVTVAIVVVLVTAQVIWQMRNK